MQPFIITMISRKSVLKAQWEQRELGTYRRQNWRKKGYKNSSLVGDLKE